MYDAWALRLARPALGIHAGHAQSVPLSRICVRRNTELCDETQGQHVGRVTFPACRSFYAHLSSDGLPAQNHKSPKTPYFKGFSGYLCTGALYQRRNLDRRKLSFGQAKVRYFDIANKAAADRCSAGSRLHRLYSKIERYRFNTNWHHSICVAQV